MERHGEWRRPAPPERQCREQRERHVEHDVRRGPCEAARPVRHLHEQNVEDEHSENRKRVAVEQGPPPELAVGRQQ